MELGGQVRSSKPTSTTSIPPRLYYRGPPRGARVNNQHSDTGRGRGSSTEQSPTTTTTGQRDLGGPKRTSLAKQGRSTPTRHPPRPHRTSPARGQAISPKSNHTTPEAPEHRPLQQHHPLNHSDHTARMQTHHRKQSPPPTTGDHSPKPATHVTENGSHQQAAAVNHNQQFPSRGPPHLRGTQHTDTTGHARDSTLGGPLSSTASGTEPRQPSLNLTKPTRSSSGTSAGVNYLHSSTRGGTRGTNKQEAPHRSSSSKAADRAEEPNALCVMFPYFVFCSLAPCFLRPGPRAGSKQASPKLNNSRDKKVASPGATWYCT